MGETPITELENYIKAARILGTDILRLWCRNKNSQEYSEAEQDYLFGESIKAAEIAEGNGVKLCMECHNGTCTNTKDFALELMHSVNSSSFRIFWQPNFSGFITDGTLSLAREEEELIFRILKEISPCGLK